MNDPHPHWRALGSWGTPESYIKVNGARVQCGNCGEYVSLRATACYQPSFVEGARPLGCGVRFVAITSPFERDQDFCERIRPDLDYVVKEWA